MLGVSGAGISMVTVTGNRGVVCATDDISARIEDLQFMLGVGPCMDAVGAGSPVLVADLRDAGDLLTDRWPGFMTDDAVADVRAVFAFPLQIGVIAVGTLDLYRSEPGDLTADQLAGALIAADAAALALLHLDAGSGLEYADEPTSYTGYQMEVHQATGMVQVQLGITTEEAFLALRARAFANERPLADIATDVVARRLRFAREDK
jgi:hypothetical protein